MEEKQSQLQKLEWLLDQIQEIGGSLILDNKIQMVLEAENEQLRAENEQLKRELELLKAIKPDNSNQPTKEKENLSVEDKILRVVKNLEKKQLPTARIIADYIPSAEREHVKQGITNLVQAGLLTENVTGKTTRYISNSETELEEESKDLTLHSIQRSVLDPIGELLYEMTILRRERDKEEKANERRKTPIWDKHDALSEKAEEKHKLLPIESGLCMKWCKDPSFECYVILYD